MMPKTNHEQNYQRSLYKFCYIKIGLQAGMISKEAKRKKTKQMQHKRLDLNKALN